MQIKTFVINLKKDINRHDNMKCQLDKVGISHEFINAIDGRLLSNEEIEKHCNFKRMMRLEGRIMTRGEVGYALSHLLAYRQIVENKLPYALVLEDDLLIKEEIVDLLANIQPVIKPEVSQVYLLFALKNVVSQGQIQLRNFRINKVKKGHLAHAYIVTRMGAINLLRASYPITHVIDWWWWESYHKIAQIYSVSPSVCLQSREIYGSLTTVGRNIIPDKYSMAWWRHKSYRGFCKIVDRFRPAYLSDLDLNLNELQKMI